MKFKLKKQPWGNWLFYFCALLSGIAVIVVTIMIISVSHVDISSLKDPLAKPLIIYDRNGAAVSERSSTEFTAVPLSEIPKTLTSAVVAVEDKRFYKHSGVDTIGIMRAAWRNLQAGSIVEGGSTLTQQLAKNLFLSPEQTYSRKFKEIVTAYRIEQKYSKEQILELYLNQVYFGEGAWGVQDAAQTYFGKDIQDISLSESALLAGLLKSPTHYSPYKDMDAAKARRDLVLSLLYDQKIIDKGEYDKAVNEKIILRDTAQKGLKGEYPGYVDYVIEEAINKYGIDEEYLLKGGLHVYTQMDPVVQNAIETAYAADDLFPESSGKEIVQSAAVTLDPENGGIRGIIGYRGQHYYRGFDRAAELKRQPGSAIKPLAVYAPALENGYTPSSILMDMKTDYNGYTPTNLDGVYRGVVTLSDALIYSINAPAVSLLNEIGIDKGVGFLERCGIPMNKNGHNLSIALGGFTEGVSPLQMAQAFSVFPNLGVMNEAQAITKITTSTGKVLLEVEAKPVEVTKPEYAYTMTKMLVKVVEEGTGTNAALGRPTAGKTGTTQLPDTAAYRGASGVNDAWFVGYTPELVTAVWAGYDKTSPDAVMQSSGGNHPAKIFQTIMSAALQNTAITEFEIPKDYKEEMTIKIPKIDHKPDDGDKHKGKKN